MKRILNELKKQGYKISDNLANYYSTIEDWESWWKGFNNKFHKYQTSGANGRMRTVKRYRMNMGKKVCEDWSNLLLNDKTYIIVEDKKTQKYLTGDEDKQNSGVLGDNSFWMNANRLVEKAFAKGTAALILGINMATIKNNKLVGGSLQIRYIKDAEKIVPLGYENGEITECAFVSFMQRNGKEYAYVEKHLLSNNKKGKYHISNEFYLLEKGKATRVPNFDNIIEDFYVNAKSFFIVTPNVENNILDDIPMGLSIYANAIDQLKGCDLSFDNLCNDFMLAKKKIFIDKDYVLLDAKGNPRTGDTLDQSVYAVVDDNPDPKKETIIKEYNPIIRVDENKQGIQLFLDLLSAKVGLGQRRYTFENNSMATATQVRTSNKDLTESVWKQRILVQDVLIEMTRSILEYGKDYFKEKINPNAKITIQFDDTMFTDEEQERLNFLQEIRDGVKQKWEYRVKYLGESKEEAKKMCDSDMLGFDDEIKEPTVDTSNVKEVVEQEVSKTLNGAQTKSLMDVISKFASGELTIGQAIGLVSTSIGVTREEAKKIIEGV